MCKADLAVCAVNFEIDNLRATTNDEDNDDDDCKTTIRLLESKKSAYTCPLRSLSI